MKALLLNGSPRQGNTHTALEALKKGMNQLPDMDIQQINAAEAGVSPCIACQVCGSSSYCVADDDTNDILDAVAEADVIVFATPVYWWGMTAQLKVIIDKFYSKVKILNTLKKKVGVIVIGEAEQDDPQYEIIPKQFECICDYLGWDVIFSKTYTADGPDDLAKSEADIEEIGALWKLL